MRIIKFMLSCCLQLILLSACNQSSYKISGTVEEAADGDTIILNVGISTPDLDEYSQQLRTVVRKGTFELQGDVDSVQLCTLYMSNQPDISVIFFLEPGNIKVHLAKETEQRRVGGTEANDALQQLGDTLAVYSKKMQKLSRSLYYQPSKQGEQIVSIMEQMQQLEAGMEQAMVKAAEENYDNELGFFILTNLSDDDDFFPPTRLQTLIDRMPTKYRQRNAIKELENRLKKSLSIQKGSTIKDFSLSTPDGATQNVMDIISQNKLTIIDFWASWCGPCRQEMPNMVSLYRQYRAKGLAIIGVSLDESHADWTKAIQDLGMEWPQISDLKGWQSAAAEQFQVRAIPHVIVVDQKGTILEKGLRGAQLQQYVEQQLGRN